MYFALTHLKDLANHVDRRLFLYTADSSKSVWKSFSLIEYWALNELLLAYNKWILGSIKGGGGREGFNHAKAITINSKVFNMFVFALAAVLYFYGKKKAYCNNGNELFISLFIRQVLQIRMKSTHCYIIKLNQTNMNPMRVPTFL